MGAWGFGLFESDHDYDIVDDFTSYASISELENEVKKQAELNDSVKEAFAREANHRDKEQEHNDRIYLSIYANHCSTEAAVELVRHYLDSGILVSMVAKLEAKKRYSRIGYDYVLLGACAMTLGCHLPINFKLALMEVYDQVGLMDEGLTQMRKALHGPNGYVNGVPYDFGSLGLLETAATRSQTDEEGAGKTVEDLPQPEKPVFTPELTAVMTDMVKRVKWEAKDKKVAAQQKEYGVGLCGGCGAEKGQSGAVLLACSKCKQQNYCSKECQKKHWKSHKAVCVAKAESKKD